MSVFRRRKEAPVHYGLHYGLAAETLAVLADAAPVGFDRVRQRRWVGESRNGIRQIFDIAAVKGARYYPRWGWGLDAVPKVWSPRPTWKRTAKSADFDLVIDPVDEEGNVPSWCTLTSATTPRAARTVATEAWRRAQHDFAQVVTPEDLRMLFVRRSEMTFRRFGLDHYMQTDIARGLLEISLGREAEGEARLRRFCERFDVDIEDRILRAAVSDARLRARENGFQ